MEQKPPQSSDTQQTPPQPGQNPEGGSTQPQTPAPAGENQNPAPKPEEHSVATGTSTPPPAAPAQGSQSGDASQGQQSPSGAVPPAPGQPHDPQIHKSNAMLFAIVTLFIVIIGAVLVTIMSGNPQQPAPVNTTVVQPTQPPVVPTEAPTAIPSPATPEEEVEAVNVTEDNTDLQEVEQDLESL